MALDFCGLAQPIQTRASAEARRVGSAKPGRYRNCDAKGRALMGRSVKQVLLLHMNYLNSLYVDDLLQRYRDDGWSFISLEEALQDEVYRLKYDYVGAQGAGHLDAVKRVAR